MFFSRVYSDWDWKYILSIDYDCQIAGRYICSRAITLIIFSVLCVGLFAVGIVVVVIICEKAMQVLFHYCFHIAVVRIYIFAVRNLSVYVSKYNNNKTWAVYWTQTYRQHSISIYDGELIYKLNLCALVWWGKWWVGGRLRCSVYSGCRVSKNGTSCKG